MTFIRIAFFSVIALGMTFTLAFATGEEEKGRALFNDPNFAGGVKACSSCHPNGQGLEKAADKKVFHVMGKTQKNLEEAINACIVYAIQGKAIDAKSVEMKELVAYIKSLKAKNPGS